MDTICVSLQQDTRRQSASTVTEAGGKTRCQIWLQLYFQTAQHSQCSQIAKWLRCFIHVKCASVAVQSNMSHSYCLNALLACTLFVKFCLLPSLECASGTGQCAGGGSGRVGSGRVGSGPSCSCCGRG